MANNGILKTYRRCTTFSALRIEDFPPIKVASLRNLVMHAMRRPFLSLDNYPQISISTISYFMIEKPGLANVELHIMDAVQQSAVSEVETTTSLLFGARSSTQRIVDNPALAYPIVGRLL
jgi:hypothetical protein